MANLRDDALIQTGQKAKEAEISLRTMGCQQKDRALLQVAEELLNHSETILSANQKDIDRAKENGMTQGMIDRLLLTSARIEAMAEGLRQIAGLEDPVGEILGMKQRPNGLLIGQKRVPLGVVGIIYESRPNVTADAFAIAFKAGNAVILKGGSDALESNIAITNILREALRACGVSQDALSLIASKDREDTNEFMKMRRYVDVLIPRGSAGLIRAVVENSKIPVIETGSGNCHIYVDKDADFEKAVPIILNAKTQRTGVCNAAESLVVHEDILQSFLPVLSEKMKEAGVTLRADDASRAFLPYAERASEEDFAKEYLALMMSVKTVRSLQEAIDHINRYHTKHSDCIITENKEAADLFLREIDSACVYVNASTRFTDGYEFGFEAEIGISTQKLNARGPMGLPELTSYKYLITGNGQIRK